MRLKWQSVSIFALLALCFLGSASLFAEGEQKYPIKWAEVPGAGGYIVEVQNDQNATVVSQTVTEPRITLNLYPGEYTFRLTTLNRFMRTEATTDWFRFHVLAPTPPVFVSIEPATLLTGQVQTVLVTADKLSRESSASVVAPSGKQLPITVEHPSRTTLSIELPILDEKGKYQLVLTNPPNLTLTVDALFVQYSPPTITSLSPDNYVANKPPKTISLLGSNFSPEAAVFLTENDKETELEISSKTTTEIIILLPKSLPAGEYKMSVRNSPDTLGVGAPMLRINPAPPKAAGTSRHDALISLGWAALGPFGDWERIYAASAKVVELGFDLYLTANRKVPAVTAFNASLHLEAGFSELSTKAEKDYLYAHSDLDILSVGVGPAFELAFRPVIIRLSPGGGIALSHINGRDPYGNPLNLDSLDFLVFTRLSVDFPIHANWRIQISSVYRYYFANKPLSTLSLGLGLILALPAY